MRGRARSNRRDQRPPRRFPKVDQPDDATSLPIPSELPTGFLIPRLTERRANRLGRQHAVGREPRRPTRTRPAVRPALSHHQAARHRRDGRRLSGVGRGARRRGRAEGHPAGAGGSDRGRGVERRFKRELLLARQVTHKNVVRIHDLGEIDGIKYITMSYVEGETWRRSSSAKGKLPVPERCAHRAAGRARVWGGARGRRRAPRSQARQHHDRRDDEALIMDFGIARSTGGGPSRCPTSQRRPPAQARADAMARRHDDGGADVGTVEYMAPEQARGDTADQRADIYALGLILTTCWSAAGGQKRRARSTSCSSGSRRRRRR